MCAYTLFCALYIPQEAVNTVTNDSKLILIINKNTTLNCSQGFTISPMTGLCKPVCGEWNEFSHNTLLILKTITSIFFAVHFIGTVVALILSCYNYKTM